MNRLGSREQGRATPANQDGYNSSVLTEQAVSLRASYFSPDVDLAIAVHAKAST